MSHGGIDAGDVEGFGQDENQIVDGIDDEVAVAELVLQRFVAPLAFEILGAERLIGSGQFGGAFLDFGFQMGVGFFEGGGGEIAGFNVVLYQPRGEAKEKEIQDDSGNYGPLGG